MAQQVIHLVLADTVAAGQPQQGGPLVRRVVVDVHVRMGGAPPGDVLQEVQQGLTFLAAVVCPERAEDQGGAVGRAGAAGRRLDHPEQVLQAALREIAVRPERVALEVEEDVARAGRRERGQPAGVEQLVEHRAVAVATHLQTRLRGQRRQRRRRDTRHVAARAGEVVDGADPGREQPFALRRAHAGHQQQVTMPFHLRATHLATPAGAVSRIGPLHRVSPRHPLPADGLRPGMPRPVDRNDVGQRPRDRRPVPQQQHALGGNRHLQPLQLVGVRGDLQQRRHRRVSRQFRIVHHPAPVRAAHQEIGDAVEPGPGERGLVEHVRAAAQRRRGAPCRVREAVGGGRAGPVQPEHAGPGGLVILAESRQEPVEGPPFVCQAQCRGALAHRVDGGRSRGGAPECDVQVAQPPEFARDGARHIRRADHQPARPHQHARVPSSCPAA